MTIASQVSATSGTSNQGRVSGKGKSKRSGQTGGDPVKPLSRWTPHIPVKTWVWAQLPVVTPCSTGQNPLPYAQAKASTWMTSSRREWCWNPAIILEVKVDPHRYPNCWIPNLQNGWADVNFQPPMHYRGSKVPPYNYPGEKGTGKTCRIKGQRHKIPEHMSVPGSLHITDSTLNLWREHIKDTNATCDYPKGPWDVLYYVHYKGRNRRHDKWLRIDDLLPIECDPRTLDSLL